MPLPILTAFTLALTGCAAKISPTVTDAVVGTPNPATGSVDPNPSAVFRPVEPGGCFNSHDPKVPNLSHSGSTQARSNGGFKNVVGSTAFRATARRVPDHKLLCAHSGQELAEVLARLQPGAGNPLRLVPEESPQPGDGS